MKAKHAVVKRTPIELNGIKVGESLSVEYQDGAPKFGVCQELHCEKTASRETLIGLQFCKTHFGKFYSDENVKLKP
jgi:hypothetical protein